MTSHIVFVVFAVVWRRRYISGERKSTADEGSELVEEQVEIEMRIDGVRLHYCNKKKIAQATVS